MANGGVIVVISGQDDTGRVFDAIDNHLKQTTTAAHETESALGQLGERAKRYLEYAGIAFGVRETIDAFKEVVTKSVEFGEQLSNTSKRTGLAIETLSTLHYAAGVTGQDFDGLATAVGKMGAALGTAADGGNKKAAAVFASLGLNAKELANQSDGVEVAFERVAKAIAATESPARRLELAQQLLGKAGQQQVAVLAEVGQNWDEFKRQAQAAGVYLNGEQAAALEETNRKLKDLQQSLTGDALALTQGLTPALTAMLSVVTSGKPALDAFKDFGQFLGKFAAGSGVVIYGLVSGFDHLAEAVLRVAQALDYLEEFGRHSDLLGKLADGAKRDAELYNAKALALKNIVSPPSGPATDAYQAGLPQGENASSGDVVFDAIRRRNAARLNGFQSAELGGGGGEDKLASVLAARNAAQLRLDEQMAQLRAQAAKAAQEQQLAQLEADHARNLVSDQTYYAQKLAIEQKGLDAQRQAALEKQAEIDKALTPLEADAKKHGNDVNGINDQAKILELRTKKLALDGEIAKINADSAKAEIEAQQKIYEISVKQTQQVDELAAKREALRGGDVTARLGQSADNYDIQRKALVANYGEGSQQLSDADFAFTNEQNQIRVKGAEETSGLATAGINAQRTGISDQEARGGINTQDAQRQRIALDQQEAAALQPVLAAYEALAQGGDLQASEKVLELQSRIEELKAPVDEISAHMRDSFDSAFEGLFTNLDQGMKDLESFTKSIQHTLSDAAYKRLIEPGVQNLLGGLIPNKVPGAYGDPGIGGVHIPANPGTDIGGGAVKAALGIGSSLGIPGLGGLDGKKGGKTITINLVNDGPPLVVANSSSNETEDSIVAKLQNNFETGGWLRQLLTGFHGN